MDKKDLKQEPYHEVTIQELHHVKLKIYGAKDAARAKDLAHSQYVNEQPQGQWAKTLGPESWIVVHKEQTLHTGR